MGAFKEPHGGELKNLYLDAEAAEQEKVRAKDLASWDLTPRQLCDIDLLLNGAFSPLEGFLNRADYDSVCDNMRLENGVLWPMPITLDVSEAFAEGLEAGQSIALRDPEGVLVATLEIEDVWAPDKTREAEQVFGTTDDTHPAVNVLFNQAGSHYVGGKLRGVEAPTTTTSSRCASLPRRSAPSSRSSAGARSWPSRPATRCTARTRNSRSAPRRKQKPTC